MRNKYNFSPGQYVLFKSLTGDSCDNIKGVQGIGPIRASKIINKTLPFNLKTYSDIIELNRKLIQLNTCINLKYNELSFAVNQKLLSMKNQDLFTKLKF